MVGMSKDGTQWTKKGKLAFFHLKYRIIKIHVTRIGSSIPGQGQIPFEKTPNYYDRPFIPKRILKMDPNAKVIIIFCDNVRRVLSRLGFEKVVFIFSMIIFWPILSLFYIFITVWWFGWWKTTEINPIKIFTHKRNSKSQTWCDWKYFWPISSSFEPIHWWNEECPCWYSNNCELRRKIFGNFIS